MTTRPKIFDNLAKIAPLIPVPLYWLDRKGIFLGGNELCLEVTGAESLEAFIGKTYDKIHPLEIAEELVSNILSVIELNQTAETEEIIVDFTTGRNKYFLSIRSPLHENGEIVGIIATSIDITAQKEKEILELENQAKQARIEEQMEFRKIADQVAHDIRSPISTMQMILPLCDKLPENLRTSLNKSAIRISDIANNLLNKFKQEENIIDNNANTSRLPTLISADLLEIITEKKYEYGDLALDFITKISQSGYFAFINIDAKAFTRTLSNLINNAVDAVEGKVGEITIYLYTIDDKVQIIIEDNGKGMSAEIKAKILNKIMVTAGKLKGHGIGFDQIREALTKNDGKLDIESEIGVGTKVIITFPRIANPEWIAEKIELYNDTFVIILDDDESIHGAWQARFKKSAPYLKRKHFREAHEVVLFIDNLETAEKNKIFLLTDYELLRQDLNGLDVIHKTGITNSILVTSHHNNLEVRNLAKLNGTKILPKPLASEVLINIYDMPQPVSTVVMQANVDLVIIDDDKEFVSAFKRLIANENKTMDIYFSTQEFVDNIKRYSKDTMILIDNSFGKKDITGIEFANQLHMQGFEQLYLFSGRDYSGDNSLPSFLTPILKTDIDKIKYIIKGEPETQI